MQPVKAGSDVKDLERAERLCGVATTRPSMLQPMLDWSVEAGASFGYQGQPAVSALGDTPLLTVASTMPCLWTPAHVT